MGARVKPDRARLMSRVAEWRSNPDLSRKASLNTIAAALDYGARTVVELILNPMLVAGLGTYLYGAWRVLWRLTGYIWASSGRSSQALQWAIANKQHTADHEEKRRHVGSAIVVWFIFLPLLGSIGAICVWAAPYALKTPARYVGDVRITAALLVADAVALTLLTVPRSVLQGENLGYKRMGLSALLVVGQGALTALALILDNRDRRRGGGEHRGHAHHRRHVPAGRPPSCSMVRRLPSCASDGQVVPRPELVVHGMEGPDAAHGRRRPPRARLLRLRGTRHGVRVVEVRPRGAHGPARHDRAGRVPRGWEA